MKGIYTILLLVAPTLCAISCLNNEGNPVDWWVVLKVPGDINKTGHGYYDSKMTTGRMLVYSNPADHQLTALWRTIDQINNAKMQLLAWNDEWPNGTVSSSAAHSKTLIAVLQSESHGIIIDHSIPKYPAILSDGRINSTIGTGQLIYGQHLLCMTTATGNIESMSQKWTILHPFIYHATIGTWSTYLYRLSQRTFGNSTNSLETFTMQIAGAVTVKTVFKNNLVNCSIFEDGLTGMLKSKIVAESWGRPLQPSWCTQPYTVTNVKEVSLSTALTWSEYDDHSKWALSDSGFSCFGDMNRMPSQWKRGGAFYCLNHPSLHAAMRAVIKSSDTCAQP